MKKSTKLILAGSVLCALCIGLFAGVDIGRGRAASEAESAAAAQVSAEPVSMQVSPVQESVEDASAQLDGVQATVTKADEWKDGSSFYAKYEVSIKNTGSAVSGWRAVLTFDAPLTLAQIWNGSGTVSGNELSVTAADYNKELAAGGELSFGFIASFSADPTAAPSIKLYSGTEQLAVNQAAATAAPATATPEPQQAAPSGTPVEANGKLSVKGTQIVNEAGQPFIIKGVSTHGIAWFPQYINLESFRTLRDSLGCNTVRLALYSSQSEGYKKELHAKIDEGVAYATQLGMYVVLDWHVLGSGNPNTDKAAAEAFFEEMAAKYKDYNNVIYEICNEPNGDVQWERDIKPYAQSIISIIRAADDDAIIIVGTPTWSQDVDVAVKSPLEGQNLVYAFHFYAGTHKERYREKVTAALNAGLPVLVSEFGISDASGNGALDEEEGDRWMAYLDERNIGRICWALSNKNESCSLISPDCQKTSGWSDSELSQAGRWLKKTYTK